MIVVVQTECANIQSVSNSLSRLGTRYCVTDDRDLVAEASHLILPGVGHARAAMEALEKKGLVPILRQRRKPLLGICLGMQILFDHSEEGDTPCLGLLPGRVRAIPRNPGLPLPHMGWNRLERSADSCPLLEGIDAQPSFYFVHSFQAPDGDSVLAHTQYGERIPAIVGRGMIMGTQFHPEKSGPAGQNLLRNFLNL